MIAMAAAVTVRSLGVFITLVCAVACLPNLRAAVPDPQWRWQSGPAWPGSSSTRVGQCAVWTERELLLWGGYDYDADSKMNTGIRYNPATGTLRPMSTLGAPGPRYLATAVWTGREMIVWGGEDRGDDAQNDGGRYDPVTDTWRPTSMVDVPGSRTRHTAVWTGREMIIWGGARPNDEYDEGGRYDPVTDTWTTIPVDENFTARQGHSAVWTGSEMLVFGGYRYHFEEGRNGTTGDVGWVRYTFPRTFGRYDPAAGRWTVTELSDDDFRRADHTAVWTGREMIVWGGFYARYRSGEFFSMRYGSGARFDPATGAWRAMAMEGVPEARHSHEAVWTGREMIVWGGEDNTPGGGHYDPALDRWQAVSLAGAPASGTAAVWIGSEMLVHWDRIYHYFFDSPYRNDGIPDEWQFRFFGDDQSLGAADADPDRDGQNNRAEYLAGTDPVDGSSRFLLRIERATLVSDQATLVLGPINPARGYEVQAADAVVGPFAPISSSNATTVGLTQWLQVPVNAGVARFFRVRFEVP